jgi:FtsP/CotA-like multicopper oxidase with cupredoxin domain
MVRFNAMRRHGLRLLAAAAMLGLAVPQAARAQGGMLDCLPIGLPLQPIPEIATQKTSEIAGAGRVLRGTILLASEKQRLVFRQPTGFGNSPGKPGLYFTCAQQTVRVFRGLNATPPMRLVPQTQIGDPIPGPTLRARLGDIVQLTFVNNIDPGQYALSSGQQIDQGEKKSGSGSGSGCDSSTAGYPGSANDAFPDCFHGSSTGNIHFHGTHTNPNGTGDNVFLEIRPSPIVNGKPTITDKTFAKQFNGFFKACSDKLKGNPALEWPMSWNDAPLGPWDNPKGSGTPNPNTWTGQQAKLIQAYDQDNPTLKPLWPLEQEQLQSGLWPQYYIGAYPYCFQIPEKDPSEPWTSGQLKMGQSPGTHWYHAHKHGSTAINVANGMTGVFIIEGSTYDDKLNDWYGPGWMQRQPILVMNQLGVTPNLLRSGAGGTDKGPDFSVNGRIQPVIDMKPGEVQLWRIANTAGRSGALFLGPPPGFSWMQIAQDGVQFADENYQNSKNQQFYMAAGNRVDLLVKAPLLPAIYPVLVQHAVGPSDPDTAYPVPLVSVRIKAGQQQVTGKSSEFIDKAPTPPKFLDDITDAEVQGPTRELNFLSNPAGFPSNHTINGKKFDGYENAQEVFLNTVEEWKIVNSTLGISHPFHIHVNPFQLVELFNPSETVPNPKDPKKPLPKYIFYPSSDLAPGQCILNPNDSSSWKPCGPSAPGPRIWWDVFPIPSAAIATDEQGKPIAGPPDKDGKPTRIVVPGYFKMRSRFVDYPGYYVLHCHILAHEDRGMMATVEVTLSKEKAAAPTPIPFHHH